MSCLTNQCLWVTVKQNKQWLCGEFLVRAAWIAMRRSAEGADNSRLAGRTSRCARQFVKSWTPRYVARRKHDAHGFRMHQLAGPSRNWDFVSLAYANWALFRASGTWRIWNWMSNRCQYSCKKFSQPPNWKVSTFLWSRILASTCPFVWRTWLAYRILPISSMVHLSDRYQRDSQFWRANLLGHPCL